MEPHYRLRQRLEARIADDGRPAPHGIIIVNGYRETPPAEREQQYTNALRVAAESMRYTVVLASDLFETLRGKLEGKSDGKDFCKLMLETEGVLKLPEPVGAAAGSDEETTDES
jgi:hypothetical protein